MDRLRLLALAAVAAGIAAGPSAAAAQTGVPVAPIATDRPGNGNAATTVPSGRLQVETSVAYSRDAGEPGAASHAWSLPTMFRYGLTPWWEARVGHGIVGASRSSRSEGRTRFAATDGSLGSKIQLLTAEGARPDLAMSLDVFLPIGQAPFTADAVVPELRAAASWQLPAGLGLLLNVGGDVPEAGGRHVQLLYVANLSWALPVWQERLAVFAEVFGREPLASGRASLVQIDAGLSLSLTPDLQLDAFSQHGLADAAPDFQLALGISFRV